MWHPRSLTRSEARRAAPEAVRRAGSFSPLRLAVAALLCLGACDSFSPRSAPTPCDPDTDPDCKPLPPFLEPQTPELVRTNIQAAVQERTVQPNYVRSLTPEPADQPGLFTYIPDPGAEAQAPPGFFVGWNKDREVQFMLTLLEASAGGGAALDSLNQVELAFPRYTVDPTFPSTPDLTRYDVEYVLALTYESGDPPVERTDRYAGRAKWDLTGGNRNFWTLLRWEDISPLSVPGATIIGTMGTLRVFVGP